MYAIVEISGKQFKVKEKDKIFVPHLKNEEGTDVKFEKVLFLEKENDIKIGTPFVDSATVEAKVLKHIKDDKVLVFKKKRRKSYRLLKGHRQQYTQIEISKIS
ncbi:MAG TPA: 50S ribosomal protein L21 [Bacteroidota bacterium]|jgi:large subunit ribosomal protein L21|nr:50S ribosomal protein L21 [Bacteroidota bacterium]